MKAEEGRGRGEERQGEREGERERRQGEVECKRHEKQDKRVNKLETNILRHAFLNMESSPPSSSRAHGGAGIQRQLEAKSTHPCIQKKTETH